jgi:cob(I)alamin adenosyltransferase
MAKEKQKPARGWGLAPQELALRAKGSGKGVCFIQFLKGGCESSENRLLKKVGIRLIRFKQRHPAFYKNADVPNLNKNILRDLAKVRKILRAKRYDVVILDEILCALKDKFIKEKDILNIIESLPKKTELILSGISCTANIARLADYISYIKNIKHPYQKGVKARRGIEF